MTLLEPTWYNTNIFEALFLKIFNKEPNNTLMIDTNIKVFPFWWIVLVCFKFVHYLLSQRFQTYQANMIYVFAT